MARIIHHRDEVVTENQTPAEHLGRLYVVALVLATVVGAFVRIPLSTVLSSAAPALQSYAKYIYFIDLHVALLRETGSLWGYDPTFAAGYLTGAGWMVPYLGQTLAAWLLGLSGQLTVKLTLLIYFLTAPLGVYLAARWLDRDRLTAALAGLLCLAVSHFSIRTNYVMTGLVNSALAHSLILPGVALIYRLTRGRSRAWVAGLVLAPLGIVIGALNPTALAVTGLAVAGLLWWRRRELLRPSGLVAFGIAAVVSAVVLWPWALPGLRWAAAVAPGFNYFYSLVRVEWRWAYTPAVFSVCLQPMLLVILVAAVWQTRRWRAAGEGLGLYLSGIFAAIVAWVVAIFLADQAANVYPVRFLDAAYDFLLIPAAALLARALVTEQTPSRVASALHVAFWPTLFQPLALYALGMITAAGRIVALVCDKKIIGFVLAPAYLFVAAMVAVILFDPHSDPQRFHMGPYFGSTLVMLPGLWFFLRTFFPRGWRNGATRMWALFFLAVTLHLSAYNVGYYLYGQRLWEPRLTLSDARPELQELAAVLRESTTSEARILVENGHNSDAQALGFDIVGLLPLLVPDREFYAVPDSESAGALVATHLIEGVLAWVPLTDYTDDELSGFLHDYNIGWVVVATSQSAAAIRARPGIFTPLGDIGSGLFVFQVERERDFFLAGSGRISAAPDRLELEDLTPDESGRIVISYHLYDVLRTVEGVPLLPAPTPFDPIPLIALQDPPRQVTIVRDTRRGYPDLRANFDAYYGSLRAWHRRLGVTAGAGPGTGIVIRGRAAQPPTP
jgi:hypothetical protein